MDSEKKELLGALAWMCEQYIGEQGVLDHMCMSAGEKALVVLNKHGMVDSIERGASWTARGKKLLDEA